MEAANEAGAAATPKSAETLPVGSGTLPVGSSKGSEIARDPPSKIAKAPANDKTHANVQQRKYKVKVKLRQAELAKNADLIKECQTLLGLSDEDFDRDVTMEDATNESADQGRLSAVSAEPLLKDGRIVGFRGNDGNEYVADPSGALIDRSGKTVGYMDDKGGAGFLGPNGSDIYDLNNNLTACLFEDGKIRNLNGEEVRLAVYEPTGDNTQGQDGGGITGKTNTPEIKTETEGPHGIFATQLPSAIPSGNGNDALGASSGGQRPLPTTEPPDLFTPAHSTANQSDSNGVDDEVLLFEGPGPKVTSGVQTVGFTHRGSKTLYINMHGKKSAAKYRLEEFAAPRTYPAPNHENASNPENRLGDKKRADGKPMYTKRHILGIYGVAWEVEDNWDFGDDDPDDEEQTSGRLKVPDLDFMNPRKVAVSNKRWKPTFVRILWDTERGPVKAWEPRAALRSRWGTDAADKAIYKAACAAERRYEEAAHFGRWTSQTPAVGFIPDTVQSFRDQSLFPQTAGWPQGQPQQPFRDQSLHPQTSALPQVQTQQPFHEQSLRPQNPGRPQGQPRQPKDETVANELARKLNEFKISFCELYDAANFRDLDPQAKAECINAWTIHRNSIMAN